MQLFRAIKDSFTQLSTVIDQLSVEQYTSPSQNLNNATIGQHTRHIIEMYQCLLNGYESGSVCYDHRKRDVLIETDKVVAKKLLVEILQNCECANKEMELEAVYGDSSATQLKLNTNYYRELAYNLEHTVHHMALIRVGLKELNSINITEGFGVASSTIRYREQ
jgi:hypothetical protein